jgi:hypothetical protein
MSVDDVESFISRKLEEYRCQTVPNAIQYLAELWIRLYKFSEKSKLEKYLFVLAFEWRYSEACDNIIILLSDIKKFEKILPEYQCLTRTMIHWNSFQTF